MIAVGVDAGGTGTSAIAVREGIAGKRACAGPANANARGLEAAVEMIVEVVTRACDGAVSFALFVGASGAGRPAVARAMEERLRAHFSQALSVRVEDDVRIAFRSAISEGPGIALIAGTGSIAYAEQGECRVRVGGAGYLLGDEGSAFAIGAAAVRAAVRAFDGVARADAVTEMVLRELGVTDRDALLAVVYATPLPDVARIAGLAPHVLLLAGTGDRAATKMTQFAAKDLGDLVCAAARQAQMLESSPTIALCGGLLRENSLLTYVLQTRLQADIPGASIVRPSEDPALTAARFAQASCAERRA